MYRNKEHRGYGAVIVIISGSENNAKSTLQSELMGNNMVLEIEAAPGKIPVVVIYSLIKHYRSTVADN